MTAQTLLEAQQRLQDSGYFDSVFLSLQTDGDPQAAPVQVTLREATRTSWCSVSAPAPTAARALSVEHTDHQLPVLGWRGVSKLLLDRDNQKIGTELTSQPDEACGAGSVRASSRTTTHRM
jgi:translocation and assembly module TamA